MDKRRQMLYKAERLAMIEIENDPKYAEKQWWNKLASMSEEEMDMLPYGFTIKYGSFIQKLQEQ